MFTQLNCNVYQLQPFISNRSLPRVFHQSDRDISHFNPTMTQTKSNLDNVSSFTPELLLFARSHRLSAQPRAVTDLSNQKHISSEVARPSGRGRLCRMGLVFPRSWELWDVLKDEIDFGVSRGARSDLVRALGRRDWEANWNLNSVFFYYCGAAAAWR